jgi:hypothetical protein
MAIEKNSGNIPDDSEASYEELASQEEIYLEETEVEVHAVLESYHSTSSLEEVENSICGVNSDPCRTESLDEQLDHAAEELITGDSDDPPLSEDAAVEMVRMTHLPKRPSL